MESMKVIVEQQKDWLEYAQSFVTTVGIVMGGLWAAWMFATRRQKYPRAKIEHQIFSRNITADNFLVRLHVEVTNCGEVLLPVGKYLVRLQEIDPCPENVIEAITSGNQPLKDHESEVAWYELASKTVVPKDGHIEIEPGESHQFDFDFFIGADANCILLYTYFTNQQKLPKEIGWSRTTLYELSKSTQGIQGDHYGTYDEATEQQRSIQRAREAKSRAASEAPQNKVTAKD